MWSFACFLILHNLAEKRRLHHCINYLNTDKAMEVYMNWKFTNRKYLSSLKSEERFWDLDS